MGAENESTASNMKGRKEGEWGAEEHTLTLTLTLTITTLLSHSTCLFEDNSDSVGVKVLEPQFGNIRGEVPLPSQLQSMIRVFYFEVRSEVILCRGKAGVAEFCSICTDGDPLGGRYGGGEWSSLE